jgi:hypothetical protein
MKAISFGSLRVRLVLLVLLAVIPALGLILYTARVQRSAATMAAHENLSRTAKLATVDTLRVIKGAQQLLGGLAACRTLVARLFCDDDGLRLKSERARAYREHACTSRQY